MTRLQVGKAVYRDFKIAVELCCHNDKAPASLMIHGGIRMVNWLHFSAHLERQESPSASRPLLTHIATRKADDFPNDVAR